YQVAVTVPARSERTATVYTVEPSNGYHAELRDPEGRLLTSVTPTTRGGSGPAVAVVSDVAQADQRIDGLLRSQSQLDAAVSRFPAGQGFPAEVIRLTGLNAVILDQFDTGSLGPDQRRALMDFVGLGGTLIEAGGVGARRTLAPLPAELVPLRPAGV